MSQVPPGAREALTRQARQAAILPEPSHALLQCERCGAPLSEGAGFCRACGSALAGVGESTQPLLNAAAKHDPQQIGQYRILEKIGEGGMGIVYKAEQRQPVKRVVALKIIRAGMDSKEVVARFEAERQALALMDHPNVAKVLEAGMIDNGRPFFAMEFVPGVPIHSYCDINRLTTKERLALFIPVCQAVQHAHHKGIIHRDLKPGNILVTLCDGKPTPKVIDFGVAKATSFTLTDKTLFTHSGGVIGTVEYMSPEQATGSGLDVDTRTDVYSLGVVLYQLLTGTLPFEPDTFGKMGIEARARIILEIDPPRPSVRLAQSLHPAGGRPADSAEIARCRRTDPRALRRELERDLDWIVLKAMEKDRTRRYETANELSMDLQRHLDDEPVLARPPSAIYRMAKFSRRHKVGIIATAATVAAMLAGTGAATYAIIERGVASRERLLRESKQHDADEARQRAQKIGAVVQDVFATASSTDIRRTPRQTLDDMARLLLAGGLAGDTISETRVRTILARRYTAIGLYHRAIPQFRAVVELNRHTPASDAEMIDSLNELADALVIDGDLAEAEPIVREAFSIQQKMSGPSPAAHAMTLDLLGSILAGRDDWAAAERVYRQAWEIRQNVTAARRDLADSLAHRGEILLRSGDSHGRELIQQALDIYGNVFSAQPAAIIGPLRRMAREAAQRGDWLAADQMLPPRLRDMESDLRLLNERAEILTARVRSSPDDLGLLARRAKCYGRLGEFERAAADLQKLLDKNPDSAEAWHHLLPLLQAYDVGSYVRRRHEALERFASTQDAQVMHQISKSSLGFRIEGPDMAIAQKMANTAFLANPQSAWYAQSAGMAAYRARHPSDAVRYLMRSRDHVYVYRDLLADFYIAMAYAALGDQKLSRSALESGRQLWQSSVPKSGEDDLEEYQDWILCSQARSEAEAALALAAKR